MSSKQDGVFAIASWSYLITTTITYLLLTALADLASLFFQIKEKKREKLYSTLGNR